MGFWGWLGKSLLTRNEQVGCNSGAGASDVRALCEASFSKKKSTVQAFHFQVTNSLPRQVRTLDSTMCLRSGTETKDPMKKESAALARISVIASEWESLTSAALFQSILKRAANRNFLKAQIQWHHSMAPTGPVIVSKLPHWPQGPLLSSAKCPAAISALPLHEAAPWNYVLFLLLLMIISLPSSPTPSSLLALLQPIPSHLSSRKSLLVLSPQVWVKNPLSWPLWPSLWNDSGSLVKYHTDLHSPHYPLTQDEPAH